MLKKNGRLYWLVERYMYVPSKMHFSDLCAVMEEGTEFSGAQKRKCWILQNGPKFHEVFRRRGNTWTENTIQEKREQECRLVRGKRPRQCSTFPLTSASVWLALQLCSLNLLSATAEPCFPAKSRDVEGFSCLSIHTSSSQCSPALGIPVK